jgi:hypothetical protein
MAALAAVGCLGVSVTGALVIGGILYLGQGDLGNQAGTPARDNPTSEEDSSENVAIPTDDPTTPDSPDSSPSPPKEVLDLRKFSVGGFFPRALARAKKHHADARFVRLDATGMNSEGFVDFTAHSSSNVIYRFRSPAKSQPPANFPKNATFESNCMVYIMHLRVQLHGVHHGGSKRHELPHHR